MVQHNIFFIYQGAGIGDYPAPVFFITIEKFQNPGERAQVTVPSLAFYALPSLLVCTNRSEIIPKSFRFSGKSFRQEANHSSNHSKAFRSHRFLRWGLFVCVTLHQFFEQTITKTITKTAIRMADFQFSILLTRVVGRGNLEIVATFLKPSPIKTRKNNEYKKIQLKRDIGDV